MPELPEVETIRRDLRHLVLGKGIRDVRFHSKRCILSNREEFLDTLKGNRFEEIRRRGKLLIFELAFGDKTLLIHLKMTGQLVCEVPGGIVVGGHPSAKLDDLPNQYTHAEILFADGTKLYFNDVRSFGWLKLVDEDEKQSVLGKLGRDPIAEPFEEKNFLELIDGRKAEIKSFLLNQSFVAGIGNIYADEILHRARIRPGRKIPSLSLTEKKRLYRSTNKILVKAVEKRGTTFSNFVDASGQKGGYYTFLRVYDREGERCHRCGDDYIQKTVVAGRGTHFCPNCQI